MRTTDPRGRRNEGTALLAVLWLSAALGTIAIALADTVRGEADRSATAVDSLRARNLAMGGLRRALLYIDWGRSHPEDPRFKPAPHFAFDFPEGQVVVEVIPETAKININVARPEDLFRLLMNLGTGEAQAQEIAAAIVDWRSPPPMGPSVFDEFYRLQRPPYQASHAFFQEIEELLSVKGVTPDLYYGTWQPAPEGAQRHLVPRTGLRDCVTVFGNNSRFDVNTAPAAVLATIGIPPEAVAEIVQQRRVQPFLRMEDLMTLASIAGPNFARLRIGGNTMLTLRASGRVRLVNGQLSDMRRTVAALVKTLPAASDSTYHILRWYDTAQPDL